MKNHLTQASIVLALLITHVAFAADPFAPSLKFLDPVSKPMPNFKNVFFYDAIPDSQGTLKVGIGGSQFVKAWFPQMEQTLPQFSKLDSVLASDVGVYEDTVKEQGQMVLDAAKGNFRQSMEQLNEGTDGKIFDLLDEYRKEIQKVNAARILHRKAQDDAEAASFGLKAEDEDLQQCLRHLKSAQLKADRADIESKIKQGRTLLDGAEEALSAVAGGPKTLTSYIEAQSTSMLKTAFIELVYAAEQRQLMELGTQIAAIDKVIQDNMCQGKTPQLEAARLKCQARMKALVVSFGKILDHRANAWAIVDQLAALEKAKRKTTFFQELQTYNTQVNTMGAKVFKSVSAYQSFLSKSPVSRGDFIYDCVKEDLAVVTTEKRDKDGKWTEGAENLRGYLADYGRWHHGEAERAGQILENLRAGQHLHFVDSMISHAAKQLGATVDPEDIIR